MSKKDKPLLDLVQLAYEEVGTKAFVVPCGDEMV